MRARATSRRRRSAGASRIAALLGLATSLVAGQLAADPAATGSFSIHFSGFQYSGSLGFDDHSFDVLGLSQVNLGASLPGGMSISGAVSTAAGFPPGGSFSANLADLEPGDLLQIAVSGGYSCPESQGPGGSGVHCTQPEPIFPVTYSGNVTSLLGSLVGGGAGTLPAGPGIGYRLEGSTTCESSGGVTLSCSGLIGLNAFGSTNTPAGSDVAIPVDTTFFNPVTGRTQPLSVELQFAQVTSEGETIVAPSSGAVGDLPPNVSVHFGDWGAAFFEVTTSAGVAPPIRVCASYLDENDNGLVDGTFVPPGTSDTVSECQVGLFHKEGGPPAFVDKTLRIGDALCPFGSATACPGSVDVPCIDRDANVVCGSVDALSTFGVFLQLAPEPVRVAIDVWPFHDVNRINLRYRVPVPVAILGAENVDVTTIDAATLAFGPAGVAPKLEPSHPFDLNGDGFLDRVAIFDAQASGLEVGDTEACLRGEIDGLPFEGCGAVVVVNERACGIGFELALLLPPLAWLRARKRSRGCEAASP